MRLLAVLLFASAGLASAQQYRWTDQNGRVHYGDTPPPASAKDVRRKNLGGAQQAPAAAASVTLYTSRNCDSACADARRVLGDRGIAFTEISVLDDSSLAELKRASGAEQVPSLLLGPQALVGFNSKAWNAALDAAGYPSAGSAAAKSGALPPVSLYITSECGKPCVEARAYLQAARVPFTEVPVQRPPDLERLRSVTGQQEVPALTVGKAVQIGFDAADYARVLSAAGYALASR